VPIHMGEFPSYRATTISLQMPEDRTAVLCISPVHYFLLTQNFGTLSSRIGNLLWQHWRKRVVSTTPSSQPAALNQVGMTIVQVLSAPLARYRRHGRLPESRWLCAAYALGLAVVPTDRLWAWYVPFHPFNQRRKFRRGV
jgi:hypothetical protein